MTDKAQFFFDELMKEENLQLNKKGSLSSNQGAPAAATTTQQQAYATQQPRLQSQQSGGQFQEPNTPAFQKKVSGTGASLSQQYPVSSSQNPNTSQQYPVGTAQNTPVNRTLNPVTSSYNPQSQPQPQLQPQSQQFLTAPQPQLGPQRINQQLVVGGSQAGQFGAPGQNLASRQIVGAPQYISGAPLQLPRTVTQIAQSRLQQVTLPRPPAQVLTQPHLASPMPPTPESSSRVQYIPFNRKIIEYQEQQKVQVVPRTRKVVDYRQELVIDVMPKQVTKQDYYAVQYIKQYVPEYVPERMVNMVQRAVPFKRIQYVPVTRQVYHGAPFGGDGGPVGLCSAGMMGGVGGMGGMGMSQLNQFSQTGTLPWQNNASMGQIYGTSLYQGYGMGGVGYGMGGYGMGIAGYGGWGCCDSFKRRFNNIYDSYDSYIPSFQY